MEMTDNHLDKIMHKLDLSNSSKITPRTNNIMKYLNNENKTEKRLLITHVFPNSTLFNLEVLTNFDIISEVNGKKCKNLADYRKAMKNCLKIKGKKYIEITTEINKRVVLLISDLLDEEKTFSETYKYNLSKLYHYFNKTIKRTKKKQIKKKKLAKSKKNNHKNKNNSLNQTINPIIEI